MRGTQTVMVLGEDVEYTFTNCTPYEALEHMIYFINCSRKCNPVIQESETGRTLWFEDDGKTYAVTNSK